MASHLERVLGFDEEVPDTEELSIEGYLEADAPDIEAENPVLSSNMDMGDDLANPLDSWAPAEEPDSLFDDPQGSFEIPEEPMEEEMELPKEEPPPTDEQRRIISQGLLDKMHERLLNSIRFQNRAELLNLGADEDPNSGE